MVRISEIFSILCILGLTAFVCTDAFALNPDSISGEISIPAYLLAGTVDKLAVADLEQTDSLLSLRSYEQGLKDGSGLHDPFGFFLVGLSGGTVFGVLGAYGAYSLAAKDHPTVNSFPDNCIESEYQRGYTIKSKSNNKTGAIIGGTLGTAIHTILLIKFFESRTPYFHLNIP